MPVTYVQPPLGGIAKKFGFQATPPFSSYDSMNFVPFDAVTGRKVSATRPPRVKLTDTLEGQTVNCLQRVNGAATQSPQETMVAAADGILYWWTGADWEEVEGDGTPPSITTGRPVYAATFLKRVFIFNDTTAPVVFNYADLSIDVAVATAGTFPANCRFGTVWKNSLWVGGDPALPNAFHGSANNDPFDWDFSDLSDAGAFTSVTDNNGLINGPITAFMPATSDIMFIGGTEYILAQIRHPKRGGELETVSTVQGVLSQGAWCKDDKDTIFFLSKMGLCTLDPRSMAVAPISKEKIPDELLNVACDYLNPTVCMAYDSRWNVIHITVRGDDQQAWFYDLEMGGFHRVSFDDYPLVLLRFDPLEAEGQSAVLYGGVEYGGVSRLDTTGTEDFHFHLVAGPIKLASSIRDKGVISYAQFVFSGNTVSTADVSANLWAGATAEDAVARYEANRKGFYYGRTLDAHLLNGGRCHPNISGNAVLVEISGGGDGNRVVFDGVELQVEKAGHVLTVPTLRGASTDPAFGFRGAHGFPLVPGTLPVATDPAVPFNPAIWAISAQQNIPSAPVSMVAFPHTVDLHELPQQWWTSVMPDGRDIRPVVSGQVMPFDLIGFDRTARAGVMVVRASVGPLTTPFRIYAGNPYAVAPAPSSSIGQYNAYDENTKMFIPHGYGADRTRFGHDLSPIAQNPDFAPVRTITTPIEGAGAAFLGVAGTTYLSTGSVGDEDMVMTAAAFDAGFGGGEAVLGVSAFFCLKPLSLANPGGFINLVDVCTANTFEHAAIDNSGIPFVWGVGAGIYTQSGDFPVATFGLAEFNSAGLLTQAGATTAPPPIFGDGSFVSAPAVVGDYVPWAVVSGSNSWTDPQRIRVGENQGGVPAGFDDSDDVTTRVERLRWVSLQCSRESRDGGGGVDVAWFRVDGVRRPNEYIARVNAMADQSEFWGSWSTTTAL